MNKFLLPIGFMIIASTSTSCGMSLFNANGAIVEDKEGKFRTIAVKSDRRIIMFNDEKLQYCAEPPPDVAQNISGALRATAEASGGKLPAEVGAEFSKAYASTAQKLMNRSQGLQLYRDGMYFLCQGFFNGVIPKEEFKDKSISLLETVRDLIKLEITVTGGNINSPNNAPAPPIPELPPAKIAPKEVPNK